MSKKIVLMVTGVLLGASAGWACKCQEEPSVAWSFGYSDAVFIGEVESVGDTALGAGGCAGSYPAKVARIRVTHAWSGVRTGARINVVTGDGGGDCGYRFEGKRHLIYATRFDPRAWTTNICTRTRPMPFGAPDSVALSQLRHR
jgi:hypothetical protein